MKKFFTIKFLFLFIACCISACSTKYSLVDAPGTDIEECDYINQNGAMESFAMILSKAVANETELRAFIKQNALEQFDKDYDVFYPFVCDREICKGRSLSSILRSYCGSDEDLDLLVSKISKLTILVPDFSWVNANCFSVINWDTSSNQVAVTFDNHQRKHPLFFNGEFVGELSDDEIPSFPVLIVKNNERMVELEKTKSGMRAYGFASPYFDNLCQNKTKVGTWEGDWPNDSKIVSVKRDLVSEVGDRISSEDLTTLSPFAIPAYQEFNTGYGDGVQRDYVFYGMTNKKNTSGVLNRFRRDMIYRMKITRDKLFECMDDSSKDPQREMRTGRDDRPDFDPAITRMWANGNFEIKLDFYQGKKNGNADQIDDILLSIYAGDLMYLGSCHDVFQWNIFGNNWSVYTIKREEIQPKWYYPGDFGNVVYLHNEWNLNDNSQNIWFKVSEVDATKTYSQTKSNSFKYNLTASIGASGSVLKGSLGGGFESGETSSLTVSYTEGEDNLGSGYIEYIDSYLTGKNADGTYNLGTVTTYSVELALLPIDIREKEKIKNHMLGRRSR